jgi:hypothetical protein
MNGYVELIITAGQRLLDGAMSYRALVQLYGEKTAMRIIVQRMLKLAPKVKRGRGGRRKRKARALRVPPSVSGIPMSRLLEGGK